MKIILRLLNLSKKLYLKKKEDILALDLKEMVRYGVWEDDNFLAELPKKFLLSFLLFVSDRLVGFIVASAKSNFCVIHRLVIDQKYQNIGLGTDLISRLEKTARKHRLKKIVVETLAQGGANNFYKKNGFKMMEGVDFVNFIRLKDEESRNKTIKNSIVYFKEI